MGSRHFTISNVAYMYTSASDSKAIEIKGYGCLLNFLFLKINKPASPSKMPDVS